MLTTVGVPVQSEAEPSAPDPTRPTLLCFSHLRWDFVFQRPQHLMSRFARTMSVVYWEEPVEIDRRETPYLKVRQAEDFPNVRVVTPHLPEGLDEERREAALKRLLDAHVSICPRPLLACSGTNQLKHRVGLLARCCSGNIRAKPSWSASRDQPEPGS